jgi:H+/Cl- antiporter ClcA
MKQLVILLGYSIVSALGILFCIELGQPLYHLFVNLQNTLWWAPLIWTPAVTISIVYLIQTYAPGAAGTGSPQALIALDPRCSDDQLKNFVSTRLSIAKILLTPLAFLAGLSLGNEGPAVQIGAGIMTSARRYLGNISTSTLAIIGNGIGIAVCFTSALGGILFAIEKSGQKFNFASRFYTLLSVSISTALSLVVLEYPHFGKVLFAELTSSVILYAFLTVGLAIIASDLWARALLLINTQKIAQFKSQHLYLFVGLCALAVAVIGILTNNLTTGLSEEYTRNLFTTDQPLWSMPAKFLACLFTAWSGVSAGMFIPLLTMGGGVGGIISSIFESNHAILATIGMAAFLSAFTRAPLASCFIVLDVTGGYSLLLPVLFTTVIAEKLASMFSPNVWEEQINIFCKKLK